MSARPSTFYRGTSIDAAWAIQEIGYPVDLSGSSSGALLAAANMAAAGDAPVSGATNKGQLHPATNTGQLHPRAAFARTALSFAPSSGASGAGRKKLNPAAPAFGAGAFGQAAAPGAEYLSAAGRIWWFWRCSRNSKFIKCFWSCSRGTSLVPFHGNASTSLHASYVQQLRQAGGFGSTLGGFGATAFGAAPAGAGQGTLAH